MNLSNIFLKTVNFFVIEFNLIFVFTEKFLYLFYDEITDFYI